MEGKFNLKAYYKRRGIFITEIGGNKTYIGYFLLLKPSKKASI